MRLVIVGAGGHGAVAAEAAADSGHWSQVVFLDDAPDVKQVVGLAVIGSLAELESHLDTRTEILVAIGDNRRRLELIDWIQRRGGNVATVIHTAASVSKSAKLGVGTLVCAGAVVSARAQIGRGCIVNTAATIDHDCLLLDGVHVSPGANLAGGVTIGSCTWIGIGAAVREGVAIADNVVVGAGAAVVAGVESGARVGGVPARPLS